MTDDLETRAPLGGDDARLLATGLERPEGITTGPDGGLLAGGMGGQVYRVPTDGSVAEMYATIGGICLGLATDATGRVYVCNPRRGAIVRVAPDGTEDVWCDRLDDGGPLTSPNDCAFGPDGSLWFSMSTDGGPEDRRNPTGRLVRVAPEGGAGEVQDLPPLAFPNGVCVGGDGTLYVLETHLRRLSAYSGGRLVTVAHTPGVTPDGVAQTVDGGFVIGAYYPFHLLTIAPGAAESELLYDDPWGATMKMPANVAFYGPGLRELAASSLGGRNIYGITPPVAGAPLHYPEVGS
ncbi:MAG: SMP-30/gluconolactonase/LRE family protein [Protaetiibacter sp.]